MWGMCEWGVRVCVASVPVAGVGCVGVEGSLGPKVVDVLVAGGV